MKNTARNRHMRSRIFSAAMALMLLAGICCPTAVASADSLLSTYKDEIADAIVTVRENLETLEDDIAAIQQEVAAREEVRRAASDEPAEDESGVSQRGLADVAVSDIHDIESSVGVEHDITVDNDFLNNNSIEHDWSVNVDNSRFNNNTIVRIRETTPTRTPVSPVSPTSPTTTAPKTGDLNNIVVWIVIVAVSALAIAVIAFLLLRKKGGKSKRSKK